LPVRVQSVYEEALNIYHKIVDTWFATLKPGFQIGEMLPARLVGHLSPVLGEDIMGMKEPPQFEWFLEPLPEGQKNIAEIHITEDYLDETQSQRIATAWQQINRLRPKSAAWIRYPPQGASLYRNHFFSHSPATALAHSWLQRDLKKVFGGTTFNRPMYF
jgi:hypothetical protein